MRSGQTSTALWQFCVYDFMHNKEKAAHSRRIIAAWLFHAANPHRVGTNYEETTGHKVAVYKARQNCQGFS